MGKPKKGSKNRQDDDLEDDVVAEIKAPSVGVNDEDNDVASTKQNKGTGNVVSAFSLLAIDEPESNEDSDEDLDEKPVKTQSKPKSAEADNEPPVSKNANKKKKEKNKKPEDVDLDALLAEIQKPVEKGKKIKKKKKGGDDGDDEGTEMAGQEATDSGALDEKMDNIKVMTAEDLYPDSDEDKKKKKKKAKKGKEENKAEEAADGQEVEATTIAEVKVMTAEDLYPDSDEDKKKKKKKGKKGKEEAKTEEIVEGDGEGQEEEGEGGVTMKTAAQKKKEKKEREKKARQEKASKKPKGEVEEAPESKEGSAEPSVAMTTNEPQESAAATAAEAAEGASDDDDEGEKKSKKDKKKKKKDKAEKTEKKKKPPSAQIKAMQEALQKMKEEEERQKREEEERIAREEEAERLREEKKRLEEERKEKKKQKEKERKERLRKEGRLLTDRQKQDQKRAQQMLELMKAQGIKVPQRDQAEEPQKKRVVYGKQRKKKIETEEQTSGDITQEAGSPEEERSPSIEVELKSVETEPLAEESESKDKEPPAAWDAGDDDGDDEVKDDWDASENEEEAAEVTDTAKVPDEPPTKEVKVEDKEVDEEDDDEEEDEDEEEEESEEESDDSEESSTEEEDDDLTPIEKARIAVEKRRLEAEKKKDPDVLRAPVVCVLGHVDTGKTKILDKLRRTNVQDGEAGGITQQIGATNVPLEAIKNQTKMCKDFQKFDLKLPGLLIIDTPGHESFSNLRSRGSSLCDIAILVIDIMHGLEPQTIESIELLKSRKTPFVVALNKVDRLFGWKPDPHKDVKSVIAKQQPNCKMEFQERTAEVITQLSEQGLNAALFYENKNVREYVSLVPTSAHSGDGMGSLMALICELTQTMLAKRLVYVETLEATVMEVKALHGLGTTVDVILVNGALRESDLIVVPGTEGPIVTQVRGLLMPQPMKELRVKNAYEKHKEVRAAQGVKLIAKDLEKALAGLPMYVAANQDEVEYYKEELTQSLKDALSSIKLTPNGVYVQASTLGSLEALLEFLRTSKIPYAGINIGPVHKKDVMKASVMLEHESQYAVILAFDVKVEREAQELADSLGVTIFTADIIYHLFDQFTNYQDELKARKKEEFKHIAVFPCKLRILPNCIFNSRDPIVVGVSIEAGVIREGTPLCVPSKEFLEVGRISSLEVNHKQVDTARKGMEVCIKIENTSGEAPKLYGRHFDHTDLLVSKISRTSINALKDYFRDEMTKADWAVVVELKKIFDII